MAPSVDDNFTYHFLPSSFSPLHDPSPFPSFECSSLLAPNATDITRISCHKSARVQKVIRFYPYITVYAHIGVRNDVLRILALGFVYGSNSILRIAHSGSYTISYLVTTTGTKPQRR